MSYIVETLTNGEFKALIEYDDSAESPREWREFTTLALNPRAQIKYGFGDESLEQDELQEIAESDEYISLPVYLYDHGGITIKTSTFSCRWDSGCVGIIYAKRSDLSPDWNDEQVLSFMREEVNMLDSYLQGLVYCYSIEDSDGNIYDSCCGYYDLDDIKSEAQAELDYHADKERSESEYWACRDVVTA